MSKEDVAKSAQSVVDALVQQNASIVASDDIESVTFELNDAGIPVAAVVFKSRVSDATISEATDSVNAGNRPFKVNITVDGTSTAQMITEAARVESAGSNTACNNESCTSINVGPDGASTGATVGIVLGSALLLCLLVLIYRTQRGQDDVQSNGMENAAYDHANFVLDVGNESADPDEFDAARGKLETYGASPVYRDPRINGEANTVYNLFSPQVPVLDLSTGAILSVDRAARPKKVLSNAIFYGTEELRAESMYVYETTNDIGGMPMYSNANEIMSDPGPADWDLAEAALSNHTSNQEGPSPAPKRVGSTYSTSSQLSNLESLYSAVAGAPQRVSPQRVSPERVSPQRVSPSLSPGWTHDGEMGTSKRVSLSPSPSMKASYFFASSTPVEADGKPPSR